MHSEFTSRGLHTHMISRQYLIPWLVLGACAASATAGPIVTVITGSQQIGQMDLATGSFSPTGSIPPTIQYLVPGPNGSTLTQSFDGNLDSINLNTGAISVIGPTGFADCSSPASPTCGPNSQLSFGSAGGTLYATDFANNLYTLNPATGNATKVGATGIPGIPFIPVSTNPDGSFNFYASATQLAVRRRPPHQRRQRARNRANCRVQPRHTFERRVNEQVTHQRNRADDACERIHQHCQINDSRHRAHPAKNHHRRRLQTSRWQRNRADDACERIHQQCQINDSRHRA